MHDRLVRGIREELGYEEIAEDEGKQQLEREDEGWEGWDTMLHQSMGSMGPGGESDSESEPFREQVCNPMNVTKALRTIHQHSWS